MNIPTPPHSPPFWVERRINLPGRIRSASHWDEEPLLTTVTLIGIAATRPDGRRMVQVNLGPNAAAYLMKSSHPDLELYVVPAEGQSVWAGPLVRTGSGIGWDILESDELLDLVYKTPRPGKEPAT